MKSFLTSLLILPFFFALHGADQTLCVFYPLTIRPQQVQEILQKSLDGVTVTVFGRVNDMVARITTTPPDAILTKPLLIEQFNDYSIVSNGIRNGSPEETYVIVSIDTPIETRSVQAGIVIGVIDVLGRNAMKAFIVPLFPAEPRLKQVTKIEDLLPLLTFAMADGIMIEEIFLDYFRNTSNLTFKISHPIKPQSGIVSLAYRENIADRNIAEELVRGNPVLNRLFEVERWK